MNDLPIVVSTHYDRTICHAQCTQQGFGAASGGHYRGAVGHAGEFRHGVAAEPEDLPAYRGVAQPRDRRILRSETSELIFTVVTLRAHPAGRPTRLAYNAARNEALPVPSHTC